jgi:hypothetical protein
MQRVRMTGLGLLIRDRFGLKPARAHSGEPAPFTLAAIDHSGLLTDVANLNLHPHLPHLERLDQNVDRLEVLTSLNVDPQASRTRRYGLALSGCLDELRKLWRNVVMAPV